MQTQAPWPPAGPALPLRCTKTGVHLKAWLSDPGACDAACEGKDKRQEGSWGFGVNHPVACIGMEKTRQGEGANVLLRARTLRSHRTARRDGAVRRRSEPFEGRQRPVLLSGRKKHQHSMSVALSAPSVLLPEPSPVPSVC